MNKNNEKSKAVLRINALCDRDSFAEQKFGLKDDGVVTGFGKITGKTVGIYSQNISFMGGSLGHSHGQRITKLIEKSVKLKCPVICINDSGGARIQDGIDALAGYGDVFSAIINASGVIPMISVICGACAGGAAYAPALTDFTFMINESYMFLTGPKVVKTVMREDVTAESLGGARVHSQKSGNAHFMCNSEEECFDKIRKLLKMIPHNRFERIKAKKYEGINLTEFQNILPESKNRGYDVRALINALFDDGSFIEVSENFAPNAVVGFGTINGIAAGIVANQPMYLAGVINTDASDKMSRFVRYCDAFCIPIITLVDTPGYLPGTNEEQKGVIRHGAKLLVAYSECTTKVITLITGKAYGGAYIAMGSKNLGADYVYAWNRSEVAVLGAEGAVDIIYRKAIAASANPAELRAEKITEYKERMLNPKLAEQKGYVDRIIDYKDTREALYNCLKKKKKSKNKAINKKVHGNMPM